MSAVYCTQPEEDPILYIQTLIRSENKIAAIKKIKSILAGRNQQHSLLLSGNQDKRRKLRRSLNGNSIAWIDGHHFFYWFNNRFETLEFKTQLLDFNISGNGNYSVIVIKKNDECRLKTLTMNTKIIQSIKFPVDCGHLPAITDNGNTIFYVNSGAIYSALLNEKKTMSSIQSIKITKSFIKPRYKKVSNYFHLFDLPDDKIMIFYGSAGYYQGFLYDYRTEKIKRLASGFSQPLISGISNNLILESQNSHGVQIKKNVLENIKESSIEANRKPNILGFLISGGSGRYKIFRLFEKSKPLLARAGRARFVKSLTYITNRKAFLMIKENMLHYQGRKSNRYQALPLVALRFKLFTAGIIFEDLNGRLFFRRNPFFRDEQEMLELYDQAMRLKKH